MRDELASEPDVTERRMFGGLAFLVAGDMAIGASGQGGAMVRVGPDAHDELVASTPAEPMEMRGRPMRGWLRIASADLAGDELAPWVARGVATARALPPKG